MLADRINKIASLFSSTARDVHLGELLRGSASAFSVRILGIAAGYIFTLLVTRGYGAEALGIFALCFTVIQIVSVMGRLGLDTALLKFVAEYSAQDRKDLVKEVYTKSVKMALPFGLFLSLALFFSAHYIAEYVFHKGHMALYFRMSAFAVLPMVLVYLNSESLRGLKKIKEFIFLQYVAPYLFAAIILTGALLFWRSAYVPLLAYMGGLFLAAVIAVAMWRTHSGLNMVAHKGCMRLKDILNVSLPMLLAGSLIFITQWTDIIMLGMFGSEVEVGIYHVVSKVAMLTSLSLFAINSIVAPKFAEFYGRGDIRGLGRVARQSTKLIFWSSFPVLLICFLFPSFILGIFGSEFRAGEYALLILVFGHFTKSISGPVAYLLQMTGKQKMFRNIMLAATIINITFNAILIPRYGINGAAFASMISMFFWSLTSVIYIKCSLKILTIYYPSFNFKQ